jgi:DNA repair exonuclease SbcCD ATPase subunit
MAEDILGISAHFDANDMLQTFDTLTKRLDKLGIDTTNLQNKLNGAWNEITTSTNLNSEKTQKAFKVIADAMATYQKQMENTPQAIKQVNEEITKAMSSIESLKSRISKTQTGTAEWNDLNKTLEGHEKTLGRLTSTYDNLQSTFSETQQMVSTLNSAFDLSNAGRSISNVATGVNAGAHAAAAAAIGTESAAHGENTTKIGEETQKVQENTAAVQQAAEASKQRVSNSDAEAEAIKRVTERLQEGKVSEDEYLRTKEAAEKYLDQLSQERIELYEKQQRAYERYQDAFNEGIGADDATKAAANAKAHTYISAYNNLGGQVKDADAQIRAIQESLTSLNSAYEKLNQTKQQQAQATSQTQQQEKEQTDKEADAIKAKTEEIKRLQSEYAKLSEQRPNFWGLGTDIKEQKFPFETLIEWNKQTGEARQKIYEAEAELEKMKIAAADVKNETADMWAGMTKEDIAGVIKENVEQLKVLKSEYQDITKVYGSNSDEAKKNKQQQEEITKEILEGKDRLKEMGVSYEDVTKQAKNAAKATKDIGDEASKADDKAKGIFDKLKSFASKGLNPENILSLVFSPKGATMAGITAVAAGLKNLSQINEQLAESMIPLKAYVDGGTLEELREQFVALEYDSSHSAEEMAAGATRWVKYFEGLRGNADAIADVTKSSNDFATVLGKTSNEAASYQLKIAGAYHQTALQAKENSTIIINATKKSTTTYDEMAQALAQTANRAQNAGVSFKELAAATSYGTSTFGSASEAASAYVMMMTRLSAQSKNEYNPSVVGATKALQNLAKSHEMNALLTSLLGKRQASLSKVFVQGAANIKQMQQGLDDETSAAKTLAGAESKIEEQEKRLANAKRALAHEINVNLTPAYANFLEDCSSVIKTIGNWGTTIKNSLKSTLQWINSVDNAIKDSTIYKLFGTSTAELKKTSKGGLRLNIDKILSGKDENSFWDNHFNGFTGNLTLKEYNDKRRKKIQEDLKKIYNQNLKKYGANSAGKAMMATIKAYNHNSEFDYKRGLFTGKEINDYVAKMVATTRLENKSKVRGESLAIGSFNGIPDSKGENKLKQLQEQQRKFREQEAEQEVKDLANTEKVKWDLYVAEKEAGIARMESATEKEVAQHKLDYEKQKHAIEEEAKNLLQTNIAAAKQKYEKNPDNKKKEGFYASGLDKQVSLTSDQKALIQAKYDTLNAQEKAYDLQQLKAKTQSLYDYLKEYGTFKEQQLAIAKEYDEKIRAAESQGDTYKVKSLQAEKQKQIGDTKAKEIESRIDYTKVFGDFGVILREQMDDILKNMKAFSKTDTFKAKPINEQKDFLSRMNELSNQYGTSKWKDINFSQLGKLINDYNQKLKKRNEAEEKLNVSSKNLAEAQEAYENAMKSGNDMQKLDAKGKLGNAQIENDNNRKALADADANLVGAQSNVTDSAQKLSGTLNSLDALLNNMKSGSISNVWNSFVDFDKKVNGGKATQAVTDTVGKVLGKAFAGKSDLISQIIGAVLTLLDTIAEQGIGGIVGGLIDSVLGAINGLLDNLLSGKFMEQIGESLINGIGGIIDNVIGKLGSVLSFGALSSKGPSAWFENSNAEKVEEAINNLSDRNKSLQQSIDDLNDTMKNSSGAKSVEAYKEAYKLQEEQNENYKKIAQEQAGYHGAHGSWNKYWGGFSSEEISRIKEITGRNDFSGNLWDLSPEEMKKLRGGAIDIWERIKNTGKGGYGSRLTDKLDDYIDQADKLQELTDQINESLTQVSFSSMKDDFVSNLMDMEKNAEDFANDFSEMMQKSVLRYDLENLLNTDLKKLYEKWGAKMQEGNLSKDDIDNLKKEYDDLVKKGIEQRDYWAKITGYTGESSQSQQTATGKGIEAITADQASSLIGIGYAVQSAIEVGNETRKQISVDISSLRIFAEQTANNISEMRDIQYQGLEQLEAINKNTAPIILIREDIASMYKLMKENY